MVNYGKAITRVGLAARVDLGWTVGTDVAALEADVGSRGRGASYSSFAMNTINGSVGPRLAQECPVDPFEVVQVGKPHRYPATLAAIGDIDIRR